MHKMDKDEIQDLSCDEHTPQRVRFDLTLTQIKYVDRYINVTHFSNSQDEDQTNTNRGLSSSQAVQDR